MDATSFNMELATINVAGQVYGSDTQALMRVADNESSVRQSKIKLSRITGVCLLPKKVGRMVGLIEKKTMAGGLAL